MGNHPLFFIHKFNLGGLTMKRWLLAITFIISTLFSADVNLSIDNFVDNGDGTATFDILMTN